MRIENKTYKLHEGGNALQVSELAFSNLVLVIREDSQYDIIFSGTPTSNQVRYTAGLGRLIWGSPHGKGAWAKVIFQH